jgi:hypothetical protein
VQQLQDELARTGSRLPEYEQRMKQLLGEIERLNGLLEKFKQ